MSPFTPKDRADLELGLRLGVDCVALSFVQRPGDLIEARGLIGDRAGLVAKTRSRLLSIGSATSSACLTRSSWRGRSGHGIPHEGVPGRQKELVGACWLARDASSCRLIFPGFEFIPATAAVVRSSV
ncbi:hypothetical protein [Bradyrhizobium sp. CCBAU 25338]|uniref:hypothetical protein n=1 Tax=unclassified Bradyrhizobium TaxID=2631580 RepID=UPI003FA40C08